VLPLRTEIEFNATSARSPEFRRVPYSGSHTVEPCTDIESEIQYGQDVKMICVYGRIRELWKPSSNQKDWSSVSKFVGDEERFVFRVNPEQNTHVVETASGRVLVYEDRKREVISQLDFKQDVSRLQLNQVYLYTFELEVSTMLLLEYCGQGIWRRVGVAWDVREDYFAMAECKTLYLL
jgi:hypothetical protein